MNAAGLIIISLGLICIIIGVKGSQHNIIAALGGKGSMVVPSQHGQLGKGVATPKQLGL